MILLWKGTAAPLHAFGKGRGENAPAMSPFSGVSAYSILHALSLLVVGYVYEQVCTFHDGCKQGIDQQIFNRKSISRKITHPQFLFK